MPLGMKIKHGHFHRKCGDHYRVWALGLLDSLFRNLGLAIWWFGILYSDCSIAAFGILGIWILGFVISEFCI
jgi:hypothetical protein